VGHEEVFIEVPNRIGLEQADTTYPGFGLPLLEQGGRQRRSLDDLFRETFPLVTDVSPGVLADPELVEYVPIIRDELVGTARSIRAGRGPQSVLHALLLEDDQTVGQVAAMLHRDPRDLELAFVALQKIGWLRSITVDGPLPRFRLVGLDEA
jgi:hypothetical protein